MHWTSSVPFKWNGQIQMKNVKWGKRTAVAGLGGNKAEGTCLQCCSPAADADCERKSVGIKMPVALLFLHTNTSWIQRGCICRDKQYRRAKIAAQNARLGTRRRSWICSACISALHVSVTFSPPLGFTDAVESLHFLHTPPLLTPPLALSLSLCCVRPSSLISRGPIIVGWPPHLLPTGALEGQKILMLTDVNLHDFLASISTTVVCLQLV